MLLIQNLKLYVCMYICIPAVLKLYLLQFKVIFLKLQNFLNYNSGKINAMKLNSETFQNSNIREGQY